MNYDEFLETVERNAPPPGLSEVLRSLWWDRKGD